MMQKLLQSTILFLASAGTPFLAAPAHADQSPPVPNVRRADAPATPVRKWETDETVRSAMGNIRNAMLARQADIQQDRLATREYQRLAEIVNTSIGEMKKSMHLPRDAADALHTIVLVDLIRSGEMMHSPQKLAVQRVGALGVLQSLRLYGEHFEQVQPGLAKAR